MKLSIVIPVFNEEKTIEELLKKVSTVLIPPGISKEIIVVDDFSTDRSLDIVEKFSPDIKVIRHEMNLGKGASVKDGFLASTGDFVVIQDADLEYDPEEYKNLLAPILAGYADVVYGSRFMGDAAHHVLYFWHYVGNKMLTLFSNMFSNLNLSDMETCYKIFTREVIDNIKGKLSSKRFGIEPEITAYVKKYRVYEVGIAYRGRTYAEGKKIGWKDGIAAIWTIIRANLFS